MLQLRLITSCILIPIVISGLFWCSLSWFAFIMMTISILAAWEWTALSGLVSCKKRLGMTILFGLIILIYTLSEVYKLTWMLHGFNYVNVLQISCFWWIIAIFLVLFYPISSLFWRTSCSLRLIFGLLTLLPFFVSMLVLRQYNYLLDRHSGSWLILYLMCLIWGMDSGAYLSGKRFGKNKLSPRVSEGKTWEGLLGGLLTSSFMFYFVYLFEPLKISFVSLCVCSLLSVLISVFGDLTESMFKREAGIKDSSNLIPGHGGVLDRIDSLTAAAPVFASLQLLLAGVF
ncbi:Phosphatidate cytidylyltransferase [Candidatus Erwinia haradaeae]|uniref:Phosphatidate cytidylyltransferase n=1 Tax=Candidatus Erwinia haradaeae TaxID=1922217 RepID=A0A451CZF1_9GAMM|nr:phosphatidate cytidylyltransferase [Candidatus Erwinia haradaeae]VFP78571.1 Phosphatidate cytidylyltransferase [Candidatus Erwinia haradaeae]